MSTWPSNAVLTSSSLLKQGYSYELIHKYKQNKWIEQIGTGAFIRSGSKVEWPGALFALQNQLNLNIHVGGKTALTLKGFSHYGSKNPTIFLFGPRGVKLPRWFTRHNWGASIVHTPTKLFPADYQGGLSRFQIGGFSVTMSSPERAVFELLYHVPGQVTFEEAFLIAAYAYSLRPDIVQQLFLECSSIKVIRLALFMAEKYKHAWLKRISMEKINTGKGKRVIVEGGVLDKKYLITVPYDVSKYDA
jgi:hypothetical protein